MPGPSSAILKMTPGPGRSGLPDMKVVAAAAVISNASVESTMCPGRPSSASPAFYIMLKKTFHSWFGSASTSGSPSAKS